MSIGGARAGTLAFTGDVDPVQFDPKLKQILLQATGDPLGAFPAEGAAEEVPVVARLVDPRGEVGPLRVVARFGPVITGRVRIDRIVELRQHPNVASLKASEEFGPGLLFSVPEIEADPDALRSASTTHGVSGRGVVLGVLDWGCDFVHPNFRHADGRTRLLALWDQRGGAQPESPADFGYGREFSRQRIDDALRDPHPYLALGYDPADADPDGMGAHGTHVLDIAAGNGAAPGSAPGVAPEAELIFVHLKGDDTRPEDTLGDSARVLEAVRYVVDRAEDRPVVINLSLGKTGGPHDASPLVVQGLDAILAERAGRALVMSTGNYFDAHLHASGRLSPGEEVELLWAVGPRGGLTAELEVWYLQEDELGVELVGPGGELLARAALGEDVVVRAGETVLASIYHRRRDPNNADNQVDIFLWPAAPEGEWRVRLRGERVRRGEFHAWIERENPRVQTRFLPASAVETHTTGTICNGYSTLAVAAYSARTGEILPFSSTGPTRDGRVKPDLSAPGGGILAARSSPRGSGDRAAGGVCAKSGTSMAAPHVAGTIALMFEAAGDRRLAIDETREILLRTARPMSHLPAPQRVRFGAGRVNAAAAVRSVRDMIESNGPRSAEPAPRESFPAPDGGSEASTSAAEPVLVAAGEASEPTWLRPMDAPPPPELLATLPGESSTAVVESPTAPSAAVPMEVECGCGAAAAEEELRPVVRRVSALLPELLVELGERELHRTDPAGLPVYDRRHPLVFGPTERSYSLTGGSNYHAANFVFNTAHRLGYRVPVFPPGAGEMEGTSYPATASLFRDLTGGGEAAERLLDIFEVVAWPGERHPGVLRRGDLLLRGPEGEAAYGHLALIADPTLRPLRDDFFEDRDRNDGAGVQCIEAGLLRRPLESRYGRAVLDAGGAVLPTRLVIRFRESAIDAERVTRQMESDPEYRRMLEHAHWSRGLGRIPLWSAAPPQEDTAFAEAVSDTTASIPDLPAAARAPVAVTLSAADIAAAVDWNRDRHPAQSGVTPAEILTAIRRYVDLPATTGGGSTVTVDQAFVEAVFQFQVKVYRRSGDHDGKAGPGTLDSLGLVLRGRFNPQGEASERYFNAKVNGGDSPAKARLHDRRAEIDGSGDNPAGAAHFTADSWWEHIVNPSFLGYDFNRGVHLALVRRLRTAERHLRSHLGGGAYANLTPAELGRTLGLTEQHKGGRHNTSSSVHTLGLALDIEYERNPWVGGNDGGAARNREFTAAMTRAALLIGGVQLTNPSTGRAWDLASQYFASLVKPASSTSPPPDTGVIYDTLKARNDELVQYLGLADDAAALRAQVTARQTTPGVMASATETVDDAARRWRREIRDDLANLERAGSNFSGRDPRRGFLSLHRDLVIALRDAACLAWGAVDFGPGASGDMMHFDCRVVGVGRELVRGGPAYEPRQGEHPCLPRPGAAAQPTTPTAEAYLPAGGRSSPPTPAFRCAPAALLTTAELPTPTADPDAALRTALGRVGLTDPQIRVMETDGFPALRPVARVFGAGALEELLRRLRYSPAQIVRPPHGHGRNVLRDLGVASHSVLLAPRLLLHVPGHLRDLARRSPGEAEAFTLECLGWLLCYVLRDEVEAQTGVRWWMPPQPGFVTRFSSTLPPLTPQVESLLREVGAIDPSLDEGAFHAAFSGWSRGLPGQAWRLETGVETSPEGAGLLVHPRLVPALDAVDVSVQRGRAEREWEARRDAWPDFTDQARRELTRCTWPAGLFDRVSLQNLEMTTRWPTPAADRGAIVRTLRVAGALAPVFEQVFRTIYELGWNDLLFETQGAGCLRGVKLPRDPDDPERHHRAARRMSNHGAGIAADFNAFENGQRTDGSMDPRMVALWEAFRFRWGRCFPVSDPMHFEYCGTAC